MTEEILACVFASVFTFVMVGALTWPWPRWTRGVLLRVAQRSFWAIGAVLWLLFAADLFWPTLDEPAGVTVGSALGGTTALALTTWRQLRRPRPPAVTLTTDERRHLVIRWLRGISRLVALLAASFVCAVAMLGVTQLRAAVDQDARSVPIVAGSAVLVSLTVHLFVLLYGLVITGGLITSLTHGVSDWRLPRGRFYLAMSTPVITGVAFAAPTYPGALSGLLLRAAVLLAGWRFTNLPPCGTLTTTRVLLARLRGGSGRHRSPVTTNALAGSVPVE